MAGDLRVSTVRRWIHESTDIEWYNRLWTLQLFMSGDKKAVEAAMKGKVLKSIAVATLGKELPDYVEILPEQGEVGTQNHALVNARINVQGLTMEPEFVFQHVDPLVRQVNSAFIRDRWVQNRWDQQLYLAGLEVEANGFSSLHCGVEEDDSVNWIHSPNMDTLFDRAHKAPSQWGWVCRRNRLTPEEAAEIYGSAVSDEILSRIEESSQNHWNTGESFRPTMRQVVEWSFYSKDHHCVFLQSIHGSESIVLVLDSTGTYRKARGTDPKLGPNPFGLIPHAWWVDSWAPGVRRPVSKLDTTRRLASMLAIVERFMMKCLTEGAPITALDISMIEDAEQVQRIRDAKSWDKVEEIILVNGDINQFLHRTPPAQIPEVAPMLWSWMKAEINAATGVGDMQRGQQLTGERKTREEIKTLSDQSGIQARHFKRQSAICVEDMVAVTRVIAAQFDTKRTVITLEDFEPIDTDKVPLRPFLEEYLPCQVLPDSLAFQTEEERRRSAMEEFQAFHQPYINLRVMDPLKSMIRTLRRAGVSRDPQAELGFTPEQAMQMQMASQENAPTGANSV